MDHERWKLIIPDEVEKARMMVRRAVKDSMPSFDGSCWKVSDPSVRLSPEIRKFQEDLGIPPGIGSREITEEEAREFFRLHGCNLPEVYPESDDCWESTFDGMDLLPHRFYDGSPFESVRLGVVSRDEAKAIWD